MNIIYIHSHDTGRYVQPYGYAIDTPNIQRFAEQGVLFRNAHCAAPTCSPSRAALLTGLYPHQNGMYALAHKGGSLDDPQQHLANVLKNQGYSTILSGVQHCTTHDPEDVKAIGYQQYINQATCPAWANDAEGLNAWYAQLAAQYLLQADLTEPLFLDCGFSVTHRFGKGEQWHTTRNPPAGDPRYVRPPAPLPDTPETREDFADYCVAANHLDQCIGTVLDAVELAGIADRTMVIITTDHGIAYPLMKCNLTGHGTGVMLMMRGPGGFKGGKVIQPLVSHVDVIPTLCEIANLQAPDDLEGYSMTPLLDESTVTRDAIFAEVNWHASPEPMRCVRTEQFNYIHRFVPKDHAGLTNCDNSISKRIMLERGLKNCSQTSEELYDLAFDPNEACNRATDPGYQNVLKTMRAKLHDWMQQTNDPLLTGRLDPKPGVVSKSTQEVSPDGEWPPAEPIVVTHPILVAKA